MTTAEAIKAESELRRGQLDRIERLLGFTNEGQKEDRKEEGTR